MGKDLGKIAGSLKAEAATFSEAMNESLAEAEKVRRQPPFLAVSLPPFLAVSLSPSPISSCLSVSLTLPHPQSPLPSRTLSLPQPSGRVSVFSTLFDSFDSGLRHCLSAI
jgi:hypothetical protein